MNEACTKILVYDADCGLCTRLSRIADWRWLTGSAARRPFEAFEGDEAARLTAAGVHDELAVFERPGGTILTGYDGLLWLLRDGHLSWLVPLLAWGPVRWLLRHDYRLVAYNRRILAPPARTDSACACQPSRHRGYRWTFILLALAWSALLGGLGAWLFGSGLPLAARFLPGPHPSGLPVLAAALALPSAWLFCTTAGAGLPGDRRLDLLGHLAWTAAAMTLPLLVATTVTLTLLLLGAAGGLLQTSLLQDGTLPAAIGGTAWALALPIGWRACRRRLPRLGLAKWTSVAASLLLWTLPFVVHVASR